MKKKNRRGAVLLAGMIFVSLVLGGCKKTELPLVAWAWNGNVTITDVQEGEILPLDDTMYQLLAQVSPEDNLLVSPYSMRMAMLMLYHAADGEAKEELAAFLELDGTDDAVRERESARMRMLQNERDGAALKLANGAWMHNSDEEAAREYREQMQEAYGCELFAEERFDETTAAQVNQWVSDKTEGKIPHLVDRLTDDTRLFLVNALYFNGEWQTRFSPKDSFVGRFQGCEAEPGAELADASFMCMQGEAFRYASFDGVRALELPYGKDGAVVMDLFIGSAGQGLDYQALFGAGAAKLRVCLAALDSGKLVKMDRIVVPMWREEYDLDGLSGTFAQSGLKKVFEKGNFPIFGEEAAMDRVLHKTSIEVTEDGTKAAAASAVDVTAAGMSDPEKEFVVDHNFAYVIRDLPTGEILFAGVINQLGE